MVARVLRGQIVVSPPGAHIPKTVPSGLIHGRIGAAFLAKTTIKDVVAIVRDIQNTRKSTPARTGVESDLDRRNCGPIFDSADEQVSALGDRAGLRLGIGHSQLPQLDPGPGPSGTGNGSTSGEPWKERGTSLLASDYEQSAKSHSGKPGF